MSTRMSTRLWPRRWGDRRPSPAAHSAGVVWAPVTGNPPLFSYPSAVGGEACGRAGFAVVDLETSGLSPGKGHRIVEIGIVRVSASGDFLDEWSTLINPGRGRDTGAVAIHRISNEMVAQAPHFRDVADDVLFWLNSGVVVAHNARFEADILTAAFAAIGRNVPTFPAIDTLRLSRQVVSCPDYRLATLCRWAQVDLRDAHTALGDARATAQLLPALLRARDAELMWDTPITSLSVQPSGVQCVRSA